MNYDNDEKNYGYTLIKYASAEEELSNEKENKKTLKRNIIIDSIGVAQFFALGFFSIIFKPEIELWQLVAIIISSPIAIFAATFLESNIRDLQASNKKIKELEKQVSIQKQEISKLPENEIRKVEAKNPEHKKSPDNKGKFRTR